MAIATEETYHFRSEAYFSSEAYFRSGAGRILASPADLRAAGLDPARGEGISGRRRDV